MPSARGRFPTARVNRCTLTTEQSWGSVRARGALNDTCHAVGGSALRCWRVAMTPVSPQERHLGAVGRASHGYDQPAGRPTVPQHVSLQSRFAVAGPVPYSQAAVAVREGAMTADLTGARAVCATLTVARPPRYPRFGPRRSAPRHRVRRCRSRPRCLVMPADVALPGSYDAGPVALSVAIAVLAAGAALDLASRVSAARGRARAVRLGAGACAMGPGMRSTLRREVAAVLACLRDAEPGARLDG
jgi:hypothetical protein